MDRDAVEINGYNAALAEKETMKQIRFLMIGGFLGAGKTTTISKLAAHYQETGKNVGIVTNDQAYDLVDTQTLRSKGFDVGEVPGACFCCKFDDLMTTVADLSSEKLPDIVIAEPVGSCTDLYATVIQPMRQLFGDKFELGPLVVLLKPEHGKKILGGQGGRGFSPQAEYIFLKQLEEADAIAINKIDKLADNELADLVQRINERFDGVECFGISARDGLNLDRLIEAADRKVSGRKAAMDVDYETYAIGEAELGWLNCQIDAKANDKFELDEMVLEMTREIGNRLVAKGFEVAHLKLLGQTLENTAVANLVSSGVEAELSLASQIRTEKAEFLVNARVAGDPEILVEVVKSVASEISVTRAMTLNVGSVQSFRPAKPVPTHRIVEP